MTECIVESFHNIDNVILTKVKEFDDEDLAVDYAKNLECLVVKVLVKDKGLVLYDKPAIYEHTTESQDSP